MGIFSEFAQGWREGRQTSRKVGAALEGIFALFPRSSLKGRTIRNAEERDRRETQKLYEEVKAAYDASPFADPDAAENFMYDVTIEACERATGQRPSTPLGNAIFETTRGLLTEEGSLFDFPEVDWSQPLSLETGIALRRYLRRKQRFLNNPEYVADLWREKVIRIFEGMVGYLPESAFGEDEEETEIDFAFRTPLVDVIDNPAEVIERLVVTMFDDDIVDAQLFEDVRHIIETNTLLASGIDPNTHYQKLPTLVFPTSYRATTPEHLVESYLRRTPFETFFACELSFRIPSSARFEHCHIVGGTGHGKTQLLQHLIHHDLLQAREGTCSVVVIDSQGDLIRTISHLAYFSPAAEKSLADKLMLIDPNDIEHPVALNMFDVNMERIKSYSPVEREKILNGTIELYEYIFGALLGAELTQKQGVIFRYLARLMLVIPNATVQTLRELMEDGKPFKPYMEELQGTPRRFFETQFFHPSFNATKSQILKRLWGVLANTTFERMFSNPENKLDLFEAMNSGKIILINTSKDLLKQEGCEIFGRFFIAMISQAAMERATIPADKRTPTFVYIDEAQDYLDEHCEALFNQARKYNVGLTVAHQNLGQLGEKLKQSIMASTSIKLAGGVSAKDASVFSQEMRCSADFIQETRKRKDHTEFACFVKHMTPQAIKITVPLGSVEKLPTVSDAEYAALIEQNRGRYCTSVEEIAARAAELERALPVIPVSGPVEQVEEIQRAPLSEAKEEHKETELVESPEALGLVTREAVRKAPDTIVAEPRPSKARRRTEAPAPLGGGGKEHKYLQNLVQQIAHDRGFRAVIEQEILDGTGRVDVALKRDGLSVACEISVTTSGEQELANVQKCLAAGYNEVIVISSDPKHLKSIEKFATTNLEAGYEDRVLFLNPESFIAHLDELDARSETREETVRGYTVKVTHAKVDAAEADQRRKAVAQVIAKSLKQMRDKE